MGKKAVGTAVVAATLSTVAILYRTLQPNTCPVEDILAAYQENADYGDITIEYPLNETLFPPEIIPPVFRWKDYVPASRAWLVGIELTDGKPHMYFLTRRQQWAPRPEDWENIKDRSLEQEAQVIILGVGRGEPVKDLLASQDVL